VKTNLEKRRDKLGKLIWVKGLARDIYNDDEILNSKGRGRYMISGEARGYNLILPRHCAGSIIGESFDLDTKLPPFKQWRFVLLAVGIGPAGDERIERLNRHLRIF
jgi:hypothetical protein